MLAQGCDITPGMSQALLWPSPALGPPAQPLPQARSPSLLFLPYGKHTGWVLQMQKNSSSSRCQASLRPAPRLHASSSSFIWQTSLIIITSIIIIIDFWTSADTIYIHISAQHCCLRSELGLSVLHFRPPRRSSEARIPNNPHCPGQEGGSVPFPFLFLFLLKILVKQIQRGVWEQPGSEGMGGGPLTASGRDKPKIRLLISFFFFLNSFLLFSFFFFFFFSKSPFVLLFQGGGRQR